MRPIKTISEVAVFSGQIAQATLSTLVTPHNSGLHFIGAVKTAGELFDVNIDGLNKALEGLSNFYNYIVVDVGSHFLDPQITIMENASCALVVTLPEILALNQTQKLINNLMSMMFPTDMLLPVLNKVSSTNGLNAQSAAQAIRKNFVGMIPQDDATLGQSLARSIPFVATQQRAPISISFHEVVRRLSSRRCFGKTSLP